MTADIVRRGEMGRRRTAGTHILLADSAPIFLRGLRGGLRV